MIDTDELLARLDAAANDATMPGLLCRHAAETIRSLIRDHSRDLVAQGDLRARIAILEAHRGPTH